MKGGTSGHGIFRGNGRYTRTLALTGTIAPGTTGTFESFRDLKLGDDGQVAFIARLTPGVGGVDSSNNLGIWVGRSDADLRLVVRTGEAIDGLVLTSLPAGFGQLDMNEDGVVWIGGFPSRATAIVFSRRGGEDRDDHGRDGDDERR